uniref:Retrovirus-related Pol polyprotein from transposon TNT 1-94 n=1 Tax=Cajanus cajan TaxID=3821 RepID=A0A151SYE6_CAJCA|nr:Retrovirus-related Pol polyprotein from transposon TNT 1-94 [Cajanus cajan]
MSASEKFVQPAIPKFDGHYDFWLMTMENFLRSKELWSLWMRQPLNKAIIECFKCHKLRKFQYECPDWEKKANYAEFDEEEELVLMSYEEPHQTRVEERWYFDSGCSNHMIGNKSWFLNLEEEHCRTVKLGNDMQMIVATKGSVRVQVKGITQVLSDVYYIPELKNNLLSIGKLQEKGLAILILDGTCKVFHPRMGLIMKTVMSGNKMFYVSAFDGTSMEPNKIFCLKAEIALGKENHLWHCRFGHFNHKALKTLAYKKMVIGLPSLKYPQNICTTCLTGKQHRKPIPSKSLWRASKQLQLVHPDIRGPIQPASNSDKRYILSFIDDFTRKTWVYFLHEKSEAFVTFKKFKTCVEKEIRASSEHTLFSKSQGGKILIVSLYVDDLIFTGNDITMCDRFKNSMMLDFDMSDLGKMNHFLGIEVRQCSNGIFIYQKRYAQEVLTRFGMQDSNAVKNQIVPGTKLSKDKSWLCVITTPLNDGVIKLSHCNSQDQVASIMTKPLKLEQFETLRDLLGVIDVDALV